MTRRKTWIMITALANILFAPFTLSSSAGSAQPPNPIYDCCKDSSAGGRYCCDQCCWFPWDCGPSGDCRDGDG